jgi:hypothetical protein
MGIGMISGALFHIHQSFVEWARYPWNTMLAKPEIRFSDFYDVLASAAHRDPYNGWAIYFPFTYVAFYPLTFLPQRTALAAVFIVTVAVLGTGLFALLRAATRGWWQSLGAVGILLGCSYPIWFCIDRGNIELTLLALIGAFLCCYRSSRYGLSLVFLIPAICLKLYPAVFLALFLAKGKLRYAVTAILVVVLMSAGSLLWFNRGTLESVALWQRNLHKFETLYVIGDGGMGGSASMWNVVKLVQHYGHVAESTWFNKAPQSPDDEVSQLKYMLTIYKVVVVALCFVVAWFVTFVETEFCRKAALLFLLMITAPPAGADYKLVHAVGAATALIVAAGNRSGDLLALMLTAAVLCPKKYWFFPDIITDMMTTDCSVGVVINPILIWVAAGILIYQGFREWNSALPVGAGPPRGAETRQNFQ